MRKHAVLTALAAALACALCLTADAKPKKHVTVDGSRTRATHTIPLLDETGEEIRPAVRPAKPFSTRTTCGDCHNYDVIELGWHFNATSSGDPGRPGEPWVMADETAGVQLPLSYRGWKGTWKPQDLGMSEWDFVKMFGRHLPGGDMGDKDEPMLDEESRWGVSGKLEINCLACHNAMPAQNSSEWAIQIGRENFRWAATGASGIGTVLNVASRLPEFWDIFVDGPNIDNSYAAVPEVQYDLHNFNPKNRVFFNVTREGSPNRCYSCHTSVPRGMSSRNVNFWDRDVHMAAGMSCTSCHRNGLNHKIVRGYEGESKDTAANTLTCRGCHLGNDNDDSSYSMGGRLGAPRPLHRGLPAVHIDSIACTACHSGPVPKDKTGHIRTTRANRLGIHGRAQWDMEVPYIMAPVYLRDARGVITPNQVMWPAFWGYMEGDQITPLTLDVVKPIVEEIRNADIAAKLALEQQNQAAQGVQDAAAPAADAAPAEAAPAAETPATGSAEGTPNEAEAAPAEKTEAAPAEGAAAPAETDTAPAEVVEEDPELVLELAADGITLEDTSVLFPPESDATQEGVQRIPALTESQVVRVLQALAALPGAKGTPVYVGGGKVSKLDTGKLSFFDHACAEPYSWALGHDVRPATQALGAGGCGDCHSDDSGFFFASVSADSPTPLGKPVVASMYQFAELDKGVLEALELVAGFRLPVVIGGIIMAALLLATVLHFGMYGLETILRSLVSPGSVEK